MFMLLGLDTGVLSMFMLLGFDAGVLIKDDKTEITAKLTNIEVLDPDPSTHYPRVSI